MLQYIMRTVRGTVVFDLRIVCMAPNIGCQELLGVLAHALVKCGLVLQAPYKNT